MADTATRPGRSFPVQDFLLSQLRRLHEAYAQGQHGKDGAWESRFVSDAIPSRIYLSLLSLRLCIANFTVRTSGDLSFRMVSFGTIVRSSGDGLLAPSALVASPFPLSSSISSCPLLFLFFHTLQHTSYPVLLTARSALRDHEPEAPLSHINHNLLAISSLMVDVFKENTWNLTLEMNVQDSGFLGFTATTLSLVT